MILLSFSSAALACDMGSHASAGHKSATDQVALQAAHPDAPVPAGMEKTRLQIAGLHCASCAKMINQNLSQVKGVTQVAWNKKKNIVEVLYAKGSTTPDALVKTVTSAGDDFKATVLE